jgi:hypothetical protein
MSFDSLKRNRTNMSSLTKAAAAAGGGEKKNYADDRLWRPTVDKAGNGYAVFRFLPAPEGEDLPWVSYFDHGFKGPTGQWYIENSLTSIGQQDPVSEANTILWNSGREEDKAIARDRKRRLHYMSNIMIVSDPGNPDNEGKIFLFKYGKKIFDKVMDVMQPQFADETPLNPFDFWEGANFKLKIQQVAGYRNYDKSEFASTSALNDDDTKLESIYNELYKLSEFTDPANYKSYEELKVKLARVLGEEGATRSTAESISLDEPETQPNFKSEEDKPTDSVAESGDETMSYFQKLAAGGD